MGTHPAYSIIDGNLCLQDVPGGHWETLGKDETRALLDRLSDGEARPAFAPGVIVLGFALEVSQGGTVPGQIREVSIAVDPERPHYCEKLIDAALRGLRAEAVKAIAETGARSVEAGA